MGYVPTQADVSRDANNFGFHPVKGDQGPRYEYNRSQCETLAHNLRINCPPSRELSVALTKLEEVMFWANASIARNEKPEDIRS